VTVHEHFYDIPSEEELARLVGSATPHFALQIRDRVAQMATALPPDHARQPQLARHLARLEEIAVAGESAGRERLDLRAKASLRDPAES
jgi:hypothetical protein